MENIYKCELCEKKYATIAERAACEQACLKKQEEDIKRLAEEKKKAEQKARHAEVTKAIDDTYDLLEKYMKDYGEYNYDGKHLGDYNIFPYRLLHHFLF